MVLAAPATVARGYSHIRLKLGDIGQDGQHRVGYAFAERAVELAPLRVKHAAWEEDPLGPTVHIGYRVLVVTATQGRRLAESTL